MVVGEGEDVLEAHAAGDIYGVARVAWGDSTVSVPRGVTVSARHFPGCSLSILPAL